MAKPIPSDQPTPLYKVIDGMVAMSKGNCSPEVSGALAGWASDLQALEANLAEFMIHRAKDRAKEKAGNKKVIEMLRDMLPEGHPDKHPSNYPEMPDGWVQGVDSKKKTRWTKKGCKWGVTCRGDEQFVLTYLSESGIQYTRGGAEAVLPTPAIAAGIADTLDFKFREASYVGTEELFDGATGASLGTIPCVLCTDIGLGLRDDQKAFLVEKAEGNYVTYLSPDYGIKAGDELLLPIVIMQYPIDNDPVLIEIPTSEKDGPTREYVPSSSIRWVRCEDKTDG